MNAKLLTLLLLGIFIYTPAASSNGLGDGSDEDWQIVGANQVVTSAPYVEASRNYTPQKTPNRKVRLFNGLGDHLDDDLFSMGFSYESIMGDGSELEGLCAAAVVLISLGLFAVSFF